MPKQRKLITYSCRTVSVMNCNIVAVARFYMVGSKIDFYGSGMQQMSWFIMMCTYAQKILTNFVCMVIPVTELQAGENNQ